MIDACALEIWSIKNNEEVSLLYIAYCDVNDEISAHVRKDFVRKVRNVFTSRFLLVGISVRSGYMEQCFEK